MSPSSHTCDVIIVAAGRGQRFGTITPKQYSLMAGVPLLRWSLRTFATHPRVRRVVTIIHQDDSEAYRTAAARLKLDAPVNGGATRQESVLRGLEALADDPPRSVLIHDAARPGIDAAVVNRVIDGLQRAPGVIPTLAIADTLKRVDINGQIVETVARAHVHAAQTPQGFHYDKILAAHRAAKGLELTDDAAVFERAGHPVITVAGSTANMKITTQNDLLRMEHSLLETRVGSGFDVHRFTTGDHVMLCGVRIAHTHQLLGHSDADVALHAATDAILGTIGAGDIGAHFPPSNAEYKNAPSEKFLVHAMELLRARSGILSHLDITIICERPKVGPHREAMVARVAQIAGVDPARISVKATTTEGLGFTGRGEGIAAQATATVRVPTLA